MKPCRPDKVNSALEASRSICSDVWEALASYFPTEAFSSRCFLPPAFLFFPLSDISPYVITALSFPLKLSFNATKMLTIHLESQGKKTRNWWKQLGIKIEAFGLWIIILCGFKDVLKNDNTKDRVIIMSVWRVAAYCYWLRGRARRGFIFRIRKLNYETKWPNEKGCSDSMELTGLSHFEGLALHLKVS